MTCPADELSSRHLLYALVGAALLLAMGVLVFASGLVAPLWAVAVLGAFWGFAVVASLRTWRRKMLSPVMWGVAVGVAWVGLISIGGAVLDWSP
jgi:hypothetical protein